MYRRPHICTRRTVEVDGGAQGRPPAAAARLGAPLGALRAVRGPAAGGPHGGGDPEQEQQQREAGRGRGQLEPGHCIQICVAPGERKFLFFLFPPFTAIQRC